MPYNLIISSIWVLKDWDMIIMATVGRHFEIEGATIIIPLFRKDQNNIFRIYVILQKQNILSEISCCSADHSAAVVVWQVMFRIHSSNLLDLWKRSGFRQLKIPFLSLWCQSDPNLQFSNWSAAQMMGRKLKSSEERWATHNYLDEFYVKNRVYITSVIDVNGNINLLARCKATWW